MDLLRWFDMKRMPLDIELEYFVNHLSSGKPKISNIEHGCVVKTLVDASEQDIDMISKHNDYFCHESSFVDDDVVIGKRTKIWHFSHIQSGAVIGSHCSLGQNVNIGNNVKIANYVKIQNNVSIYEGVELEDYVFCGPSIVFTNIKIPRSEFPKWIRVLFKNNSEEI